MGNRWLAWRMRWLAAADRRRLARLSRDHPGFQVDPQASSALGTGTYHLYEGARVRLGPGVVTERRFDGLRVSVREDAELDIDIDGFSFLSEAGKVVEKPHDLLGLPGL